MTWAETMSRGGRKKCHHCGRLLSDNGIYCSYCGKKL